MYKKLIQLLTPQEQKKAALLFGMTLAMAVLEMIGVASIFPFMAVLSDPQIINDNIYLKELFIFSGVWGIQDEKQFLLFLGVGVFVLLIVSIAFRGLTVHAQTRFVLMREYSISRRLLESYLAQPYCWYFDKNSSDLGKSILSEVQTVIVHGMMPVMTLFAQGAVVVALMILIVIVDPLLAITIGTVLAAAYGSIFLIMSAKLKNLGTSSVEANRQRFSVIGSVFGAIKEVKVMGLEGGYIEKFSKSAQKYARDNSSAQVIAQLPRFMLEAIAFGGLLVVLLYLISNDRDFSEVLPIITLYALAGYRLMPALQQIYQAFSQLRFAGAALDAICQDLKINNVQQLQGLSQDRIAFTKAIELVDVSFTYPNSSRPALENVNVQINAHTLVGFVGATGSGKTSVIDIILGLLTPQNGAIFVDGIEITAANQGQWQRNIGYVPQQIFLDDGTIAANIAFGLREDQIDRLNVEHAARIANLHDFIINDLPDGYETVVGERGVRLSGGQRQRIGIARALYQRPNLLVLDESTSALDTLTEKSVMNAIMDTGEKMTVVLIAHRLSTVENCDCIHLVDGGKVVASGTYNELLAKNKMFYSMVKNI